MIMEAKSSLAIIILITDVNIWLANHRGADSFCCHIYVCNLGLKISVGAYRGNQWSVLIAVFRILRPQLENADFLLRACDWLVRKK